MRTGSARDESFRLYRRHDSIIPGPELCWDAYSPLYFHTAGREKKNIFCDPTFCVCASLCVRLWVNRWDYPSGLIASYSSPPLKKKKVESASPSLWKFLTTPSWRITTKPFNSCWKRTTRGQSSSLPAKKTYGEERGTILAWYAVLGCCWWLATFRSLISE